MSEGIQIISPEAQLAGSRNEVEYWRAEAEKWRAAYMEVLTGFFDGLRGKPPPQASVTQQPPTEVVGTA